MPPIKRALGGMLDPGSVGGMKTPTNPTPYHAPPDIQLDRFFRNGRHPDANAANLVAEAANAAVVYRSRQVFVGATRMDSAGSISSTGAGDTVRWRWCFKSSPYCHALGGVIILGAPTSGYDQNTRARIDIYSDATESTLVTSKEIVYGASPTGPFSAVGFNYLKVGYPYIEINPDTEYFCRLVDVDYGRTISASVFEFASLTENGSGYMSMANSVMTPVVDATRENAAVVSNNLWQKMGANVLAWSVSNHGVGSTPLAITSATPSNILDTAVTTVSASSPGWTVDLTNCDRISQASGVPCVVRICGAWDQGASINATGGTVLIKNAAGATLASVTNAWSSVSQSWVSTTVNIPATENKIDIQANARGAGQGTFNLWAVGVRQQG